MQFGINIGAYPIPVAQQLSLIRQNGFSAVFCEADSGLLPTIAEPCAQYGLTIESCHAPFDHINDLWYETADGERMLDALLRSVDECADYGVPVLVTHLSSGENPPRVNDIGLSRLEALVQLADSRGVTIAFENQRMLGNLALALESFPTTAFCWDRGHEGCFTDGKWDFMALFGDRLAAIHLHDNAACHNKDDHRIPFDGTLDWRRPAAAIAQAGYEKALMLELFAENTPAYLTMGAEAYYARAAAAARRLGTLITEAARA